MDFYTLIETRKSIRCYDPDRPVGEEVVTRVLNAGRFAPSACNRQPWRFIVVSSQEKLAEVRSCYSRPWFKDAPLVLVVVGNREQAWQKDDKYNSIETDLAIAMDHLILAATAEGLGTCWIGAFDYQRLQEVLNLSPADCVFALTPLGYPPADYIHLEKKTRKPLVEITRFI